MFKVNLKKVLKSWTGFRCRLRPLLENCSLGMVFVAMSFVGLVPPVWRFMTAYGVEDESGISKHLRSRWTVVGSISPEGKSASVESSSKNGIAILLDHSSAKTYAFKVGDVLPGTDIFRLVSIRDQKVVLSDGQSQVEIVSQDSGDGNGLGSTPNPVPGQTEDRFSPLGALEAYYQNLGQGAAESESEGETYEAFMARIATDELTSDLGLDDYVPPTKVDSSRGDSSELPGAIFLPNSIDRDELPPYEGEQPSEAYESELGIGGGPSARSMIPAEEPMSALPSVNSRFPNQAETKENPKSKPQETTSERPSQNSSF